MNMFKAVIYKASQTGNAIKKSVYYISFIIIYKNGYCKNFKYMLRYEMEKPNKRCVPPDAITSYVRQGMVKSAPHDTD